MDNSLSSFSPWEASHLDNNNVLFSDCNSGGGEFSLITFLLRLLKDKQSLILICCNKSKTHYEFIFKKNVRFIKLNMLIAVNS